FFSKELFHRQGEKIFESLGGSLSMGAEIEQFDILEQKIDSLVSAFAALKKENETLVEKTQIQEEKLADLMSEVEALKSGRDKTKQRIIALLEKLEQITP
ncbi:MAG: hypothetical protein B1H13_07765, partial [Desulfobacteraceae bacterium 4484_190.3]